MNASSLCVMPDGAADRFAGDLGGGSARAVSSADHACIIVHPGAEGKAFRRVFRLRAGGDKCIRDRLESGLSRSWDGLWNTSKRKVLPCPRCQAGLLSA